MNERMVSIESHLSSTGEEYLSWMARLQAAKEQSEAAYWNCYAFLGHMAGSVFEFEEGIVNARKAGAHPPTIHETQMIAYSNLSYATKAQSAFRRFVDIRNLNIGAYIGLGSTIGAFQRIDELVTQAAAAKLDLSSLSTLPSWLNAARVLRDRNVSDEQCAKLVDMAGEVLRDTKLFWLDLKPSVMADEGQGTVLVRYRVAASPADASAMNGRFVDSLIDAGLDEVPFLITFVGTKQ